MVTIHSISVDHTNKKTIEKIADLVDDRNEPKPVSDSIVISDELYERLKYRPRELYADSSSDDDEIYISYLISKVHKDKAIICYELGHRKRSNTQTVDNSYALPYQEYSPDKIYLSKDDEKWIIEDEFKL